MSEVEAAIAGGGLADLRLLTGIPEDQWTERKSARVSARQLAVALVGFGNAEGGVVLIGLHDGRVESLSAAKENELRQASLDFTVPPVRTRFDRIDVVDAEGATHRILVAHVQPGDVVHETTSGECFLRVGDETRKLGFAQRQELYFDRGSSQYEATPVVGVDVGDLDQGMVRRLGEEIGSGGSEESILRARNLLTPRGEVTVSAYLLLAEAPQTVLPQAHVRVLRYLSDDAGVGRWQNLAGGGDLRIEGPLPHQIEGASAAIDSWLPTRRALGPEGKFVAVPIIPKDAWVEGLINAVVHRSYSMGGDHIRVSIFPSRIEIESPGRFPGLVDPDRPLEIARYARNPRVARVCSDLGITQELGEGIKRIYREMQAMGLADPSYRQTSGSVILTLPMTRRVDELAGLPDGSAEMLRLLRQAGGSLGTGDIMQALGRSRPWVRQCLEGLQGEGLVRWTGKSPQDPRAVWELL